MPYVGWTRFKSAILSTVNAAMNGSSISSVHRISLKYTDVVPVEFGNIHTVLQADLRIGDESESLTNVQVSAHLLKDIYTHIIQIASDVTVALPDKTKRTGLAIDIDTIQEFGHRSGNEFVATLPNDLDRLHLANKDMFFTSLREEIFTKLEPEYE
jgi:uncharacterized protein (TIGR04255 family)